MRKLTCALSLLSVLFLAACGGGASLGDGGDGSSLGGSTTGGSTGGTTGSGVPAELTIVAAQESIVADGQSTSLLTATLTDTTGVAIDSTDLKFETNAGSLTAATTSTGSNGQAITRLKAGISLGRATVTVREPVSGLSASVNVIFTAGSAAHVAMTLAPAQVRPAGISSVNVVVTDANGLPVSGELVQLGTTSNLSGGQFTATVMTTDVNGRAATTYQAGPSTGTDKLQASLAAAGVNASANLVVSASATTVTGIAVTLGSTTAVANGTSKTTISAKVTDVDGAPVPGSTVNFSTTAGTVVASATTGTDGIAQVALTSPTLVGTADVTASTAGLSDTQSITFVPGAVDTIALSAAPTTVQPGGTSAVRATAFDASGNRVPGVTISFNLPTVSVNNGGRFTQATVPTDANGEAATQYIAPTTGTSDTINAKSTSGKVALSLPITISNSTAVVTGLSLEAATTSVEAGGIVIVRATVDTDGSVSGIPVNFTAGAGTLSPTAATTDATGVASVRLTAPINLTTVQLSATTGNFAAQTEVKVVAGAPDHVNVTVASSPVVPGGNATISAQLLDINNNPVPAQTVKFQFATVADNVTGASVSPTSAVTDANGNVSATYQAGAANGVDTVTLTYGNNKTTPVYITVDSTAKPVGSIVLALANTSTSAGAIQTVVATVKDTSGTPLANQTVNFSATAGSFSAPSASTGANGQASVSYTAPTAAGTATLTASSGGYSASSDVTVGAGKATTVTVSASPNSVAPNRLSSVVAVVSDGSNTIANHAVTFSTTVGKFSNGAKTINATTDSSGVAVQSLTAPGSGNAVITVTAKPENASGTDTVTVDAAAAVIGDMTVTALKASIPADGTSTAMVRAHVADGSGNSLAGVTVHFNNAAGTPHSADVTTDASGNADFSLTAATVPGATTITASAGGISKSVAITFTAGPPASVTIGLSPTSVAINGATTVSATVLDAANKPVAGVTVNFTVPAATNKSKGTLASTSAITNANGVATTTYTAGNQSANADTDSIVARVAGVASNPAKDTATLTVVVQPGSLVVTTAQASITADGSSTTVISAKLLDTNGNAVPNRQISFVTNAGTLSALSATSDANGVATVTLTSATTAGQATVTATDTSSGVSNSVNVLFKAGAAKNVVLAVAPGTVSTGGDASINVQVTDANDNPVSGAVVTLGFNTPAPPAVGGNISGGQYAATLITTDSNGRASTVYTSGPTAGTDNLQASIAGVSPTTQNLIVSTAASTIGSVTLTLGNSSASVSPPATVPPAPPATPVKTTATAVVKDTAGNPLANQTVTFSTSANVLDNGTAPVAVTVTATTDSNGRVSVSQLSPTQVGNATITASTGGFSASKDLTFTARPASSVVLSVSPTALIPGGTAAVRAHVLDDNGNVVPNTAVNFSSTTSSTTGGARFGSASVTTDANGDATTQYIAPAQGAASDSITAKTAGGLTSNTVAVNISAQNATVTSLIVTSDASSVAAGQTVTVRASVTTSTQDPSGIPVNFSVTSGGGSITASGTTDATGVATATYAAPTTQTGLATITANTGNFSAQTLIDVIAGAPFSINVTVASSPVVPGDTATITAQVLDSQGNPVDAGQRVDFAINGANTSASSLSASNAITDGNGNVSVSFVAGTALGAGMGSEIVSLTAGSASTIAPVDIDPAAQRVDNVIMVVDTVQMTAGGSQGVTATVTSSSGQRLAGQTVSFTATAGSFAPTSAVTDSNGQAQAVYTASATAGHVTLTAAAGGHVSDQGVTVSAGVAAAITVSAAPGTVAPGKTSSIIARVVDGGGNPVSGHTVQFSTTAGTLASASATTDSNGFATVNFTAPASGTSTIAAKVTPENVSSTTTVTVDSAASIVGGITVTNITGSIPADGVTVATVRAHVTDSTGAAAQGVTVNFTSTVGSPSTGSAVTDASGNADFPLTAATVPGTATVTGSIGGFSKSATVTFTAGAPASVTLSVSPTTANINSNVSLSAIVKDAKGNPVPDITVNFDVSTNNSGGTLGNASDVTNASGVASVTYRTGANSGNDNFTATVASVTPATGSVTVQALFGSLTLSSTSSSVIADGTSTTTLLAILRDRGGNPVSGQAVTFSASAGTLPPAPANTDGTGEARIILTAPTTTGNATITANVPGVTASGVVQFVAGPATTLTLAAAPASVAPGGSSSLVATLTDANGNAVEGTTIGFTLTTNSSGASLSKAESITDLNGQATLTYTAGSTTGTDTVSGNAGNGITTTTTVAVTPATVLTGSLNLTLGSSSVTAGNATGVTVSALVRDTSGAVVGAGQTVTFTANDGTFTGGTVVGGIASATDTTNSSGIARVTFIPPTHTTPVVSIRAETSGFADEKTLSVKAGPAVAAYSSITANPSSMLADGTSTTTITVIEGDANGNALPDGTSVTVQSTGGTLASNTATLSSGRATFSLTAPNTSGTATVSVPAVSGLNTTVTFTGASTGDPAALGFVVTNSQISVTGVGQNQQTQITVTVLDSAGNPVDESKYNDATLDNLEARFITQPNGGETISGTQASGTISTATSGTLDVRTNNGVATLTLSSGTISGIVELQFSVLKFTGGSFAVPANVAASGALPQVSIAAGPPASMTFSGPITNAVEIIQNPGGSNSGNYGLHGKVDVRDRYGNFVPDGTVVNFALMDSVIVQDNTGTTTASSPNLDRSGNSLINRRCTTQPGGTPNAPTEATGCNVLGSNTALTDFTSTITRNGVSRGILNGDLILIRDTISKDKKRTVSSVTGQTQLVANSNYSSAANNAMFWTGSSLSGGAISGFNADGTTLTPGTGVVENGFAPFRVDYPANTGSILLGCYGYGNNGAYSDVDKRDAVPQSRQVVVSADASSVSAIDAGDFCFKAVAGTTLTPATAALSLSNGQTQVVSMSLRDGGDTVPLPYMPINCFQSAAEGSAFTVTAAITPTSDGLLTTDVSGSTSVTFTATVGSGAQSTDSVTYTCNGADTSTDITITHP